MNEGNLAREQCVETIYVVPRPFELKFKRAFDFVVAALLLLACSPLCAVVAIVIKATSRGAVLYRQHRLGQHKQPFVLLKFRTMVDGAERMLNNVIHLNSASGPLFKVRADPRITFVGRWLRRTFLDEVPQLINVLRGEMSLVGPRPCLPEEERRMDSEAAVRFMVPQGLTGPWQVSGHHDITFEQQLAVERDYVTKWTLRRDLTILLRTVPLVFRAKGI
jgi:lipopolysaccharide/colanic/teichoic acid biosynthesis glycosyltransferase